MAWIEAVMAAIPEAMANETDAAFHLRHRSSNTAQVGFMMRV